MAAEEVQEIGRRGAATLKRWLEATTFFELPFDAYNNKIDCMVDTFSKTKQFDLVGFTLAGKRRPVIVESKRYKTTGGQYKEFLKFLAIAYAHTAWEVEKYGSTREPNFYWVTFHPFNLENWSQLESIAQMQKALDENPEFLEGRKIDADLMAGVASRVTVLVFNPKQEQLSLSREELEAIRPKLGRKVETL